MVLREAEARATKEEMVLGKAKAKGAGADMWIISTKAKVMKLRQGS